MPFLFQIIESLAYHLGIDALQPSLLEVVPGPAALVSSGSVLEI